MLSDQMDSKLVQVHVSKSDFIPHGCQQIENIHPIPLMCRTGSMCKICQCQSSVSKNMSDAVTMFAAEP